ncbi:hypothetical protein Aros01_08043 [Streptosporangium roseum]|uniref:DUF3995 domain-containing protein n=1 Tax=Streptosporangium roseum TaxID=2001 RepID=UPI0030B70871
MKQQTRARAGIAVAAVLGADAVAHLFWLAGLTWPATDSRELSLAVLNFVVPFTPRTLVPLVVLLGAATAAVLASVDRLSGLGRRVPGWALRAVTGAVAAGTLLRGVLGLVWATGNGADPWTPFYWLNLAYTPVCLALFAAIIVARGFGRAGSRTRDAGRDSLAA